MNEKERRIWVKIYFSSYSLDERKYSMYEVHKMREWQNNNRIVILT